MKIVKKLLINVIKSILYIIDKDHRIKNEISMDDMKKFTHVIDTKFDSDFGEATKVFRTVPYELWELKTETKTLLAADKHRIINDRHEMVWLQDLKIGDKIKTETGIESVINIRNLNIKTHMYCIEVNTSNPKDDYNHLYYSDGILSHNTTCAAAYILWFAMFFKDKQILICANKMNQALEIMDRIKYSYENLEEHTWIRPGIVEYNKGNITFDNGSSIIARATTKDAGRGLSISLLYLDEFAFVPPRIADEFWTAISPVLATGGDCIITSTPNSDEDRFAKIWHQANNHEDEFGNELPNGVGSNGYFPLMLPYYEHPDRDEKWAIDEERKIGKQKFLQEHACLESNTILSLESNSYIDSKVTIEELYNFLKDNVHDKK